MIDLVREALQSITDITNSYKSSGGMDVVGLRQIMEDQCDTQWRNTYISFNDIGFNMCYPHWEKPGHHAQSLENEKGHCGEIAIKMGISEEYQRYIISKICLT